MSRPNSRAAELKRRLGEGLAVDWAPLSRRIERAARGRSGDADADADWGKLERAIEVSVARATERARLRPSISYPEELPVSARRDDIGAAILRHPVVIVCGETGSGKTTQLPKICLDIGRGVRGLIGHTQPRRIAARSVATRIAQELATPLGAAVGYKVRFADHTRPDAYIKLMTDGILLAETQSDRQLAAYDTIIVDEAHERSLNIDFLLGYLKHLLPGRPDLKLIITSATLDADRFARHFGEAHAPAPVIEVSGRNYPVEIRYRSLGGGAYPDAAEADDEEELEEAILATVEDLWREAPGDVLVFLPGEREIRETAELLGRGLARRPYARSVEVLPLYARLSVAEQQRIFAPSDGRRIVLATNVAETSLTVPGIRYVIDSGLARIKRYSVRNKVTLLQIEKIAQAAANQRAGRCGRVAAGVCVRLYPETDFTARPPYTEPEILRSSLAAVILRMASLELGPVDAFPFVESPAPRAIADGYQLLQELGAVDRGNALTALGGELARLPVDPRVGRMLLAARDEGCLAEVLVIASALTVRDPRERPLEKQQAADQAHLRFRDERSDFLSLLLLWQFFADATASKLSHRKLVEQCRAHFVSYLRLIEWRDLHHQLGEQLGELGLRWNATLPAQIDNARYELIHRALLAGLLSNIGTKAAEGDDYQGARGIRFYLHPGSGVAKKGAKWVLAAELVETTRLYARCAARIEPQWIERAAGDRVDRSFFDPHWNRSRGEVVASERVALYGLTLVARRPVSYGAIDPVAAREVFLREALVAGDFETKAAFFAHNRALVESIGELEHKARRQDVLVDDEAIYAFYDACVPAGICTTAAFERWRREAQTRDPRLMFMSRDALMRHAAAQITEEQYPESLDLAGARLLIKYRFAPGDPQDGLTLTVPLSQLNRIDDARLTWLVPGMVREKVGAYLKLLPKAWRNRLVPLPEVVTAFLEVADAEAGSLEEELRAFCTERLGVPLPDDAWDAAVLPPHLLANVRVVDAAGSELASGRDLEALRAQLGEAAQLDFSSADPGFERPDVRSWDFGDLPETLTVERHGRSIVGYPALQKQGERIALKLLDTREAAEAATRVALVVLIHAQLKDAVRRWEKAPPGFVPIALTLKSVMAADALLADVLAAVCDRAFLGEDPLPRTERAFAEQVKRARTRFPAVAEGAFRLLEAIAVAYQAVTARLSALPPALSRLAAEARAQRDALIHPGFFAETPWAQLAHLPRYLQALERRLVKYPEDPARDARHAQAIAALFDRFRDRAERQRDRPDAALEAYRWLLEELRVSLFAQELRTPIPVSYKRLEKAWSALSRR